MFLLCSLVVPRGPVMYTGQEYMPRPAETCASLLLRACVVTLTGGRGQGWREKLSCKAPSVWFHSACWSCNPVSSNPIVGALGFGPFSTWGERGTRKQLGKARKMNQSVMDGMECNWILYGYEWGAERVTSEYPNMQRVVIQLLTFRWETGRARALVTRKAGAVRRALQDSLPAQCQQQATGMAKS